MVGPRQTKKMMMAFAPTSTVNVVHLGIVTPKKRRKKVWDAITFRRGRKELPGIISRTGGAKMNCTHQRPVHMTKSPLELADCCSLSAQTDPAMTHQMATPTSAVCFTTAVKVPFPIQRNHTHFHRGVTAGSQNTDPAKYKTRQRAHLNSEPTVRS